MPAPTLRSASLRFLAVGVALGLVAACGQEGTSAVAASAAATTGASSSSGSGGGSGGEGAGVPALPLTIVDWNTHDFFDTINDNPNEVVLSPADYQLKRKTIGAAIKSLAPDIAVLCEIENKAILDDLNKSELGGAYAQTILIEGNDSRGIDIGVLTKVAPDKVVSHKDDIFVKAGTNGPQYHYSRDCLEVHLTFNGRQVILLGVHFKAKAAPDDPDKRAAEGQHTRAIADGLQKADPTAAILVLGDYNDTPGSVAYGAIAGAAPSLFADSADAVIMAQRYSYRFMGMLELIDHQMANPIMAGFLDPASVVITHAKGVDDDTKYSSDHAPIKATYLVK